MMNEFKKNDYLNFLLSGIYREISKYELNDSQSEIIKNLFYKLSHSDNLIRDLYILTHVKEFSNIGKYLIFVLKKTDDKIINFDNLLQNIESDKGYIQRELLNYLSNPEIKKNPEAESYEAVLESKRVYEKEEKDFDEEQLNEKIFVHTGTEEPEEDEEEVLNFRSKFLELIQTEEQTENVFELPETEEGIDSAFELPDETESTETEKIEFESKVSQSEAKAQNFETEESETIKEETGDKTTEEEINLSLNDSESSFRIKTFTEDKTDTADTDINSGKEIKDTIKEEDLTETISPEGITKTISDENETADSDTEEREEDADEPQESRIKLDEDIQKELNFFDEEKEAEEEGEAQEEISYEDIQPTNAEFLIFENEVKEKNNILKNEFDIMIYLVNAKPGDEDERNSLIGSIMETSLHLESISRRMSLEIISNIYQTIYLSFEKISDGKYDISEGTLNLFKNGLWLIIGLIKGDDYFGYSGILKSIENIRSTLLNEKEKREAYRKQLSEKKELENKLNKKYPDDTQKVRLAMLKKLITDTEIKLNSIEKISGEYQIYEALRSLSACLYNLKEIVKVSNELEMKLMSKLSEASYIFIKFLQNYRINPVTTETGEIFSYIIYNMKALIMEKPTEDIEIFISYLNDPVKIFSKKGKK